LKAGDAMGQIAVLQRGDLFLGELDVERRDRVRQMLRFGGAHDGARDDGIEQNPGESYLCRRHAALAGDVQHGFDDGAVGVAIETLTELVGL
jgi:hypothetical protein